MNTTKTIHTLAPISGKLLFFGGVYSNLQSLEALKTWSQENGYAPDHIFCTGDIVGYCAQPVECLELIRDWGIRSIAGNVEIQLRNEEEDCGCDFTDGGRCDLFSRNWYIYSQRQMTPSLLDWLRTLPHHIRLLYGTHEILLVHGSWFHTSDFIFASTPWAVKQPNFDATKADIIIAGHCGLPFADSQENKTWLNAGVIGMPANDGTDRVWFLTLSEEENGEVSHQFHALQYDYPTTQNLMNSNGLPASYARTLGSGIWDNCEILPVYETQQQGKVIVF